MAIIMVFVPVLVFQQDYNLHQLHSDNIRYVAEEAAAGAAQYFNLSKYADGIFEFNQAESIRAAEYIIKKDLKLNGDFTPIANTYWQDQITYTIEFFDDTNTVYPYLYTSPVANYTETIAEPTVIVTINCGTPRYRVPFVNPPDAIRLAAHAWKERNH